MTPNISFFTNTRMSAIHCCLGFVFILISVTWAIQIQMIWGTTILAVIFFLIALFFVMKEYNKEYEQVKRL